MRRGWILLLLAAPARAQEFSEAKLDRAIGGVTLGDRRAADVIAAWGPRAARAAPALVDAWWREEERARPKQEFMGAVDAALLAIGPLAVPELAKAAKWKIPSARARRLLEQIADGAPLPPLGQDGEPKLLELFDDLDATIRLAAARALATMGAAAVPPLVTLLSDKNPRRRHAAAFALGCIDPPPQKASGALLAALRDGDKSVRARAVVAVGRLGVSEAILLGVAEDPSPLVVEAAASALAARGKDLLPALLEAWERSDAQALAATDALVLLGDTVLDQVAEAAKTDSVRRRRFRAVYLGKAGIQRDLSMIERGLIPLLSDPAPQVRAAAAEAFGVALPEISRRAIESLLAATGDAEPLVRAAALEAAARAAPDDARVRAAVEKAAADPIAAVNVRASLLRADALSPAAWTAALVDASMPLPERVLAAERMRTVPGSPSSMLPPLVAIVSDEKEPAELRASAILTLRTLLSRRIFESRFRVQYDKGSRAARDAAERALRWLAAVQGIDGRWAAEAWNDHDVGVTGLAVLAFLAAGHTHRESAGKETYATSIRSALQFLKTAQTKDGLLISGPVKQHTLVEHAIATQALCEAATMTGDRDLRSVAEAALAFCEGARMPYLAWGYGWREPTNDTHVTAWMVTTLRVADAAGFTVDPNAYEGTRLWIDKMTIEFGRVGYDRPGGVPFRAAGKNEDFLFEYTESMTAAGIWCRMILGEDPAKSALVKKGAGLCLEKLPRSDLPKAPDFYYWYYGSLALFEVGKEWGSRWETALEDAVLPRQKTNGSWDPEDAWGFAGGRVYSTAILTLALLTPWRYPQGWGQAGPVAEPFAQAEAALHAAARSSNPRIRAAAVGEAK